MHRFGDQPLYGRVGDNGKTVIAYTKLRDYNRALQRRGLWLPTASRGPVHSQLNVELVRTQQAQLRTPALPHAKTVRSALTVRSVSWDGTRPATPLGGETTRPEVDASGLDRRRCTM